MAVTVPRLYRAQEVADLLGVTRSKVRELVAEGQLQSIRFGEHGWHRFRVEDIERLIAGEERAPVDNADDAAAPDGRDVAASEPEHIAAPTAGKERSP